MTPRKPAALRLKSSDLVACVGGPLDGCWYYRSDWTIRQQAAQRMGYTPDHPAGFSLNYHQTDRKVRHPHDDRMPDATAWTWRKP